jgi:hypothetical protein
MHSAFRRVLLGASYVVAAVTIAAVPAIASGASWSVTPVPGVASSSAAVSCASSSRCFAVGRVVNGTKDGAGERALVDEWNGTEWLAPSHVKLSERTFENPKNALGSELSGVSCASATACTAVGSYTNTAGTTVPLAEVWADEIIGWVPQTPPSPKEAESAQLLGVSCTSSEACTAVGVYGRKGNPETALVERWNGKEWTVQETPKPKEEQNAHLSGVSCTSSEACIAVGYYKNTSGALFPLAESWNGKAWTIQETPSPKEAKGAFLLGVSCTSSEACTAVGAYGSGPVAILTLAERWNGKAWTIQETPNPKEAKRSELSGVSCASSEACTAVSYYTSSTGVILTLAERWNGKAWTIQETPNPKEAKHSELFGVSCTSAEACIAVGKYTETATPETSLAERYS